MSINDQKIMKDLFDKGLKSFNEKKFYDAHEFWEDLWSDFRLSDAKFIQGLIQLSVGYFHISNFNKNGANGLFKKCLPKLNLYRPEHRGIDVENILKSVNKTLDFLSQIEDMKDFDWSLAPKLKQ
tara:strand:- start:715 stop:1089 length:375 start_codon:yes stop_codon:yes gene_type:complete